MKHIRIIYYTGLYCALTVNSAALCMLTTKFCKANKGVRYATHSYNDIQQGRRDAYQKWCTTKITWPNGDSTQKIEQPQNTHTKEDAMAYYKQFANK